MDEATATRVVELLAELKTASAARVFAVIVPASWADAHAMRLTRLVNFLIEDADDLDRLQSFEWHARGLGAEL